MALGGSRPHHSPCWYLSFIDYVKDELVMDLGLAEDFCLDSTSFAPSCNPTLDPALVFALISTLVSALVLALVPVPSGSCFTFF